MLNYNHFFFVYFVYFAICFVFMLTQRITKTYFSDQFIVCLIVILSMILYFKPDGIKDSYAYELVWNASHNAQFNDLKIGYRFQNMEILFVLYMKFMNTIGFGFREFCAFNASLIYVLSYIGLKFILQSNCYNANNGIAIWVGYCSYYALHYGAIAIRSGLAMAVGLFSIGLYLKSSRRLLPIFLALTSLMLHSSCVLFIIFILLYNSVPEINNRYYVILLIILINCLLFGVGAVQIEAWTRLIISILGWANIQGYSGYLFDFDMAVGLHDWYFLIVFGAFLLFLPYKNTGLSKLKFLVFLGLIVVCFLYPIRAISRVSNIFFLFSIPIFAYIFGRGGYLYPKQIAASIMIWSMLLVQIHLCY